MGSLVLPTFGEGTQYLRRTTNLLLPEKCIPAPMSTDDYEYHRKVYVLLELDGPRETNPLTQVDNQSLSNLIELAGSRGNNEIFKPNTQDIQSIARNFVGAYDFLTPCDNSFGAEHYIISADVVDGLEVPASTNFYKPANNDGNSSFTRLIEITMSCNSCGNEGPWQLFEGTRVGLLPAAVSKSRVANRNECVCGGPIQTEFLEMFQQLVEVNKGDNQKSDISVRNAIQIPLLVSQDGTYNEELCSTTEEYKTTYSSVGVCPAKPTASPSVSPTASPTALPTTVSPTDSPTESPNDESSSSSDESSSSSDE